MSFTLGADPEIFLVDAANSLVSAVGKIGGTKQEPRPLPIGPGFAVQEDNVAVEYNIPPSATVNEFNSNIDHIMQFLSHEVSNMGLKFTQLSAASFPLLELMDPRAREFGCDPDFDAWRMGKRNPRPKSTDDTLRTCGGHLHIGHMFPDEKEAMRFIRFMDMCAGVPSVLLDDGERRREMYGKRGAFRFKPYGVEYRSLSNFWIFTPEGRQWAWNATAMAMDAWQNNKIDVDSEDKAVALAINKNNKDVARSLVDKYNLCMA